MKIYQLKNGNIEVQLKKHKDGTIDGFVIVMCANPENGMSEAIGYCNTQLNHECKNHDEYVAWEVEHL